MKKKNENAEWPFSFMNSTNYTIKWRIGKNNYNNDDNNKMLNINCLYLTFYLTGQPLYTPIVEWIDWWCIFYFFWQAVPY